MADELMLIKKSTLTDIADSIREKKKTTEVISVTDFAEEIVNLPTDLNQCSTFIVNIPEDNYTFILKMDGDKMWGDGTISSETSHIYDSAGIYSIVCNGSEMKAYLFIAAGGVIGNKNPIVEKVVISDNVASISTYAFIDCVNLTSVVIGDSVTSIGYGAFEGCNNLANITIPDSVTSIGSQAFFSCRSLTTITIPDNVVDIGAGAFRNCDNLTSIIVSDNNLIYQSIDNNLYTRGGEMFIRYTPGKIATVFTIPNSVTSIENYAFQGCSNLISIVFPNSITSIGLGAFWNCNNLANVYYKGTAEEWDAISISNDNSPNPLLNATHYYYSETEPPLNEDGTGYDGNYWYYDANGEINIWDEEELSWSKGLTYTLNNDNASYSLTGIGECTDTDVIIPFLYEGLPVTDINSSAFKNCNNLTSVIIPDSVTSIGNSAFYKCDGLTNVEIPDSVTSIDHSAFRFCENLTNISIGSNVQTIGDYAFELCYKLTNIEIPDSVNLIGDNAFYRCEGLEKIVIPDSVIKIGDEAFWMCIKLTSVAIPDSVTYIGTAAFGVCDSLVNIIVSEENVNYQSIEGNLYSKDGTILLQYANGKTATSFIIPDNVTTISRTAFNGCQNLTSIEIPDSVTSIGDFAFSNCSKLQYNVKDGLKYLGNMNNPYIYLFAKSSADIVTAEVDNSCKFIGSKAFQYCDNLTSVAIPNSVTSIGERAFAGCSSLTSITIPDSVTSIGFYVFDDCTILTDIQYTGTKVQWKAITFDNNWNGGTGDYIITCTDGTIAKDGTET